MIDLAIVGEANPLNVFKSADAIPECKGEKDGADSWNPDQHNVNQGRDAHKAGDGEAIALCEIVRAVTPACFQRLIRLLLIFLEEAQGSVLCVCKSERSFIYSDTESDVTMKKMSWCRKLLSKFSTPGILLTYVLRAVTPVNFLDWR